MTFVLRDFQFTGGVADGLLLTDQPVEDGAAPKVWMHDQDVYVYAPDLSTVTTLVYVYARTQGPL
ncbi:MAG TPA: hypothetical protein VFR23_04270 [Jiangellaceae bacterium]|nr:hypothetical protein [Jiangellaceae bacterium]